jgi:hypothetical protein
METRRAWRLLAGPVLGLLLLPAVGCDRNGGDPAPRSGKVTEKKFDPPRCGAFNKQHVCVHRLPPRYEVCFAEGKKHTCRIVPESEWKKYQVGDHYPA